MKTMLKTSALAAVFAALMLFIASAAMAASPGGASKRPAGSSNYPVIIDNSVAPVIVDPAALPDGNAGNVIAGWDLSGGPAGGDSSGDGGSDVPLTHAVPPRIDDPDKPTDDTCDPGEPGYPVIDEEPEEPPVTTVPEPETPRQPLKQSSSLPNTGTQLALLAAAALAVTGGAWAVRQKVTKR